LVRIYGELTDGLTKVVLHQPDPTIKIISGITTPEFLTDIVSYIRHLTITPRVDRLKMFTLDGSYHTLSLGTDDLRTTYRWHNLPDEWKNLEVLIDMLLETKKILQQA
jgi:hypothetical protein